MRYNPFNLFNAKVVGIETPFPDDPTRLFNRCVYTHVASGKVVTLLERRESAGTSVSDLHAAHADGIDNTGNFHWPAEEVLAHELAKEEIARAAAGDRSTRCYLELGAGVGLCGLLLAAHWPTSVTITDGNAHCIDVARLNIASLASSDGSEAPEGGSAAAEDETALPSRRASAVQLLWHRADEVLAGSHPSLVDNVDRVVAADCLFFDQYHDALKALLLRFLRHDRQSRGGNGRIPPATVTLVAPTRGTTMQRFVDLMAAEPDLEVKVSAAYDAGIVAAHERLQAAASSAAAASSDVPYLPDRHFPLRIDVARRARAAEGAETSRAETT